MDACFLPTLLERFIRVPAMAYLFQQGCHGTGHKSMWSMCLMSFLDNRCMHVLRLLFHKHEILLTGGQGLYGLTLNSQGIHIKVKHKAMLPHERCSNNHIVLIDVNNINICVVFLDGAKLNSSHSPIIYHRSATNHSKLKRYWIFQL